MILAMKFHEALKINCADNIHVVKNEGLVQAVRILQKEPTRLFQATASVEQKLFARNLHLQAEIVLGFQVLDYQVGEVVHVDNKLAHSKRRESRKCDFQQRAAAYFNKRFWTIIRQRAQPRAEACGQNHGPHRPIFSNSRCFSTTSTPLWPRSRFARCSARKTERCWPPVQPNETIRFLKPRC